MNVAEAVSQGWTEIKDPSLFNFEKIGDFLIGVLLDLRNERIENKDVLTARFEFENGELIKFRPSYDLRQKLGKRLLGRRMMIVYESDNDATLDKGNKMKVFKLLVAPNQTAPPPYVGTDDDMPDNLR